MKFIHCSDLHLSSDMECRLTGEKARMRRKELTDTFARLADRASETGVTAVLICGDIFDEGKPRSGDKRNFIGIVRRHPDVDFLCLAGNHDESLSHEEDLPANLKTFGENWTTYSYGEVDIRGAELSDANCALLYATLRPARERVNIVMLHGQTQFSNVRPSAENVILPQLQNKYIDYLALGHIHTYRTAPLDGRGVWCYSGCLEGRGFDECGEKGYVLLNVDEHGVRSEFVPFAKRTITEYRVDISALTGSYEIEEKVKQALGNESAENAVRVYLEGEVGEDADFKARDLEKTLGERFFAASVKDLTKRKINAELYKNELSLRGEFVRQVLSAEGIPEEDKTEILRCGLAALQGEEVSFG